MAIRHLPPAADYPARRAISMITYPQQILIDIDHEHREVFIGLTHMITSGVPEKKGANAWCYVKDFKKACPEKWKEIQTELALQKLKDS